MIQGDGIDYEMAGAILAAVKRSGGSADNVGFGMGGGLLRQVFRDGQLDAPLRFEDVRRNAAL